MSQRDFKVDEYLIAQVRNKCGGALIHDVEEAIVNYRISCDIANKKCWWIVDYTEKIIDAGKTNKEKWEKYLKIFLATGKFPDKKPKVYI